ALAAKEIWTRRSLRMAAGVGRRGTSAAAAPPSPRNRRTTRERRIVTDKKRKDTEEQLTEEELRKAHGEPLPDREQMSLIKPEPYPYLPVEPPGDTLPAEPPGQYTILPVPPETD